MDADDDPEIEPSSYAGFLAGGGRSWRTEQPEELKAAAANGDGKSNRFVLYSGAEVRFHPIYQSGGDVIETREFKLAPFRANPVVLADHDPTLIIGRGTAEIVKGDDGTAQLHGTATWDLHETNPTAILVAGQHQRGLRSAVSIGYVPGKGSGPRTKLAADHPFYLDPEKVSDWRAGWFMRNPELYEWSSVAVPRDRGALQLQRQLQAWALETEDPDERVRRIVREELSRVESEIVLRAYHASPALRTAITANVLAQLPAPSTPTARPADFWEEWA